ncbi:TetR/AcrR family transcriptional regulator [Burkholderia ubonensis]|uniref:TetR/AcrR family transcriptional regulator n=1 Tax=Burkholderia ubonensis TaxID=101571 RepID=UPI000B1AEF43|nr:TetR/AcrR family transcriptional regulator [Burkholderia ubonensis]
MMPTENLIGRNMNTKRQDVVDTATRLFAQYGYQAVGIDRIIAESGVAKMTMYKYFPSKNDLIIEVLRQREADVAEDLLAFVNSKEGTVERVRAVFEWHDRWIKGGGFSGCMFINAATEHAGLEGRVLQASSEQKHRFITFFEQLLIPIVGARRAPGDARKLMILLDGAIVAAQVYGNTDAAVDAWEVAKQVLQPSAPVSRVVTA